MISYAYLRCGSKSELILAGKKLIEFPMTPSKKTSEPVATPKVNLALEGVLGQLQSKCYQDLVQACKDIAASIGANQWTTIMSVQVSSDSMNRHVKY